MKKEIIKSLLNNIEEEEIETLEVINNQRIRINDNIYWISESNDNINKCSYNKFDKNYYNHFTFFYLMFILIKFL